MNVVRTIAAELLGLFVEDWAFALAIAACIALVAVLDATAVVNGTVRAFVLFGTLAVVLLASVYRASRG